MNAKKLALTLLAVVLAFGLCACSIGQKGTYEKAVADVRNGRYSSAVKTLETLDGYKDSAQYIAYARALEAGATGDYETAIRSLEALGNFEEAAVYLETYAALAREAAQVQMRDSYNNAVIDVKAGRYNEAITALERLDGFEDSARYIAYARALEAGEAGDYETAIRGLEALGDFEKAAVYVKSYTTLAREAAQIQMQDSYNKAVADVKAGHYDEAISAFENLDGFEDSGKYIMYARCLKAGDSGDYETAVKSLKTLGDFKEAGMYIKYYTALAYEAAQEYEAAGEVYEEILLFKDVQAHGRPAGQNPRPRAGGSRPADRGTG